MKQSLKAALITFAALLPVCCCLIPLVSIRGWIKPHQDHLQDRIKEGMTKAEVLSILGEPAERFTPADDLERWYYRTGLLPVTTFGVAFGPDERVVHTWI